MMDFSKFYYDIHKPPPEMKPNIKSEFNEEDTERFKEFANNQLLYPYIPFVPLSNYNNTNNANKFDPSAKEDIKVQINDVENPHCKRKPNPLEMCPICKKYFRRMSAHIQKHSEKPPMPTPLTCRYCFKTFSNLGNLSIHLRTHTGSKPYVCDVCSKAFTQSCNLTNHRRIHTGEKPFKCPHCDRAFSQSGNLTNHIRLHLDMKPFKCHFCEKAFTQSGNLSTHLKNNHQEYLNS